MDPTGWPLFLRKFIVDFIETGVAALLVLNLIVPTTTDEAKVVAASIGAAIAGALISAARRNAGDFYRWLREKFGTE